MSNKSNRKSAIFSEQLIRQWENSDGVNFAIALTRITGWLLQVDWFGRHEKDPEMKMIPLRVYVGTDRDIVFDCRGKKRVIPYNEYVILPLVEKRAFNQQGFVVTRSYSESKVFNLPLRVKPNEEDILKAEVAIRNHPTYLDRVPIRLNRHIPADIAAGYSFGHCVIYAAALEKIRGHAATMINVLKYDDQHSNAPGPCHSIILHPDGEAEDSWGKQPLENILERYGIIEYNLSTELQNDTNERLKNNSPNRYIESYNQAIALIQNNDNNKKLEEIEN